MPNSSDAKAQSPVTPLRVGLKGRDVVERSADGQWRAIGCTAWLALLAELRARHGSDPTAWPLPKGTTHEVILARELILKARGEWKFPYLDEELCHCRMVPTEIVDQAIVAGAHTPETVSRLTMASTSCGTCRADVLKILAYRLATPTEGKDAP